MESQRRFLRLGFLALAVAGSWWWMKGHAPRAMPVLIEIGDAQSVRELDLEVRREGTLLTRVDQKFAHGAPSALRVEVKAPPGRAEITLTLVGAQGVARRGAGTVTLDEEVPALFHLE